MSRPRIALGLQGGGAYGAYGWGVLDRLLEERVEIAAVSGASAGALNGAALVSGLVSGGEEGARAALATLWRETSRRSPLRGWDWGMAHGTFVEAWVDQSLAFTRMFGSYVAPFFPRFRQMQSWRDSVRASVDLGALAGQGCIPLHISATDVLTGTARLFTGTEITLDALMASCCLPELFAAVEIEGRRYWDGGYAANPALDPLVFGDNNGATDLIVVQLTPFVTGEVGVLPSEVASRASDISFNACLMRDLDRLVTLQGEARAVGPVTPRLRAVAGLNIHLLRAPAELADGGVSKYDTRWSTLEGLRELGRETADTWLAENGNAIGAASSLRSLETALAS